MKRFSLEFRKKNCFPIVFTACYSFIIAQNHATYPGTLNQRTEAKTLNMILKFFIQKIAISIK